MHATQSAALKVLAIGPNPALQRVLRFDAPFVLGGVNRAASVSQYVGGKGQGVALAIQRLSPGAAAAAQFVGGDNGRFVVAELLKLGVSSISQETSADTRICTTLIGSGSSTELIDPSGTCSEAEVDGLLLKLEASLDQYAAIALCGTSPPGAAALFARFCERAAAAAGIVLLDGFKGVDAPLASGRVDILKLNVGEVLELTQTESPDAAAAKLLYAKDAPLRRPGALLALTDGPEPARLYSHEGAWRLSVPAIECVNAIGAGDVCTGVFLHTYAAADRRDAEAAVDAFAWGLAAACARCTREQPDFERGTVEQLRSQIRIERTKGQLSARDGRPGWDQYCAE